MIKRICPRCGKVYYDYPALSRKDNKTEICPQCGLAEALLAMTSEKDKKWYKEPKSEEEN